MLLNQRDGLYHITTDMAHEPDMIRIRIVNEQGRISYSSDPSEMNKFVDQKMKVYDKLPSDVLPFRAPDHVRSLRTYHLPNGARAGSD